MNILLITYPLNGLLMIGLPIALGIWLSQRFQLNWRLFWIGAATFILSQIGHIPFNSLLNYLFMNHYLPTPPEAWSVITYALIGGLSAGAWEETSRYVMYRWWVKDARSWKEGVQLGVGHGGIEAIILGVMVLFTFVQLAVLRTVDISTLVSADQLELARQQINSYWSAPWTLTLLGAVERAFTIPFHIASSILVLQVFTRSQVRWFWFALLYHTFVDAVIAGILRNQWMPYEWGPYAIEFMIGLSAVFSLWIIFTLKKRQAVESTNVVSNLPDLPPPPEIKEIEITKENLENTRYNG
jgi:uncharacterized membrane protein YhfC